MVAAGKEASRGAALDSLSVPKIRAENIAEHKRLIRQQVLQAAKDLIEEDGYQETSLGDVAHRVGIGRTTMYEYFTDKADLVATLVEEELPDVIEDMVSGIPPELTNTERLAELAVRMVEFIVTDPLLGHILHRELPRLPQATQERIVVAHHGLSREFGAVYQAGVEAGELADLPRDLAGRFVQDLIMSAAQALIDSDDPKGRSSEVIDAMLVVLLNGVSR